MVGTGRGAPYRSAKGGIYALTKTAAAQYGGQNIRVNSLHPGLVDTPRDHSITDAWRQEMLRGTPLGRMARPEEIASAIVFLASDASSFMTGSTMIVDGGMTAV